MKRMIPKYFTIGRFLKTARETANLSQGDVKLLLGYKSSQLISDWERGICGPPIDSLAILCKAYRLHPSQLIHVILEAKRKELEGMIYGKGRRRVVAGTRKRTKAADPAFVLAK